MQRNLTAMRAGPPIRMVVGALVPGNQTFRNFLQGLNIQVDYTETGCAHELGCLLTAEGLELIKKLPFLKQFADVRSICEKICRFRRPDGAVGPDEIRTILTPTSSSS